MWSGIRRRFQTKAMKRVRSKVMTGVELVGAGAALTGGAMLLEEAAKPKLPQGHDNVYATDSGPSLFKYETLASEDDGISASEIIGYAIITISLVIFSIIFAKIIIRIKRACGHNTDNTDFSDTEDTKESTHHTPDKIPEDTNQHHDFSLDEAMKKAKKNYENLSTIRQSTIPG